MCVFEMQSTSSPGELLLQQSLIKETVVLKQGYSARPHTHTRIHKHIH